MADRRSCPPEEVRIRDASGVWSAQTKRADNLSAQTTNDMIVQLAEGKLTYGQLDRQRTMNALAVERTPQTYGLTANSLPTPAFQAVARTVDGVVVQPGLPQAQ